METMTKTPMMSATIRSSTRVTPRIPGQSSGGPRRPPSFLNAPPLGCRSMAPMRGYGRHGVVAAQHLVLLALRRGQDVALREVRPEVHHPQAALERAELIQEPPELVP